MAPKPSAGSGFVAAREKLGAKAAAAKAMKRDGSLDDDLASAWMLPLAGSGTMLVANGAPSPSVTISHELTLKLKLGGAPIVEAAGAILGTLLAPLDATVSLVHWSDEGASVLRVDAASEEPSIVWLGSVAAVRAAIARAGSVGRRWLPVPLTPIVVQEPLAAARGALRGASWRTLEPARSAEDASLLQTWASRLDTLLTATASGAKPLEPLVVTALEEVWGVGGPLAQLAAGGSARMAARSLVSARLAALTHELASQLLPPLKVHDWRGGGPDCDRPIATRLRPDCDCDPISPARDPIALLIPAGARTDGARRSPPTCTPRSSRR